MSKRNLLSIVQDVLNDIDGDEVNSISDTLESMQVANIVKRTYEDLYNEKRWPTARKMIQLTSHATSSRPTHFVIPENVGKVEFIKYNIRKDTDTKDIYDEITYLYPKDFLQITSSRDSSSSDVDTITDVDGIQILIVNDRMPTYWTSFDDTNIIMDSYHKPTSSTLMGSRTQAYVQTEPSFSINDTFIPDMPAKLFSLLINESIDAASTKLRQISDTVASSRARRQRTIMARDKYRVNGGIRYPDYGRK